MKARQFNLCLSSAVAAFLFPGKLSRTSAKLVKRMEQELRGLYLLSVITREEMFQPEVKPCGLTRHRFFLSGFAFLADGERQPPVTNGITFWGNSFVAGPQGELLAQFSNTEEEEKVVEVSLERSEDVRRIWPFLRDRRIDAYGEILRRFRD